MKTKYTFWELISQYEIEIPIIQRDYAQGREDVKDIADKFLDSLYKSLLENTNINLDFVYGRITDNKLIPLDGQQRLTTLFLLHWYLALKDDMYSEEVQQKLSKFTYETRLSSQDFCKNLTKYPISFDFEDDHLSDLIKDSKWFFLSWKRDPTVKAMLNMLDNIHSKFKDLEETYFDILANDHLHLITFEFLPLDKFKLSDDLYLKMNSRGKPLTNYENFKTNFIKFLDADSQSKLDNEWLDIFWNKQKDKDNEVSENLELTEDGLYNFITNTSLNLYVEENDIDKAFLDQYNVFKIYEELYADQSKVDNMTKILDCLTHFSDEKDLLAPFLKTHSNISYWERVRFYAVTRFFLTMGDITESNKEIYERWIRVSKNLINNQLIQSADEYCRSIRSIKKLSEHLENLYPYIESNPGNIEFFNRLQREEEALKASLISKDKSWEEVLIPIEKHRYFDGQIGFILEFSKDMSENFQIELFEKYANILGLLFGEIRDKNDFILYRALLTKGNYLPVINNSHTFCVFEEGLRAKNDNWRKVFNGENSAILKSLAEDLIDATTEENVVNALHKVITDSDVQDWRKYFIENPDYIGHCENKRIRSSDWNIVYMARSTAPNWRKGAELYSFHFYKKYLENISLPPFAVVEYEESADDLPGILFDQWIYKNFLFQMRMTFVDTPQLKFTEMNQETIPYEIVESLSKMGFQHNEEENSLQFQFNETLVEYKKQFALLKDICSKLNESVLVIDK